jgi:Fe-S oxidoreductase
MSLHLAGCVVLLLALASAMQAMRLIRRWRIGTAATVHWRAGLLALPRRYLRDVHHIVARDQNAATMHALVAGGLLGGTLLLVLGLAPGLAAWHPYQALVALAFAAMLAGAAMVGARRLPTRPTRLSGGQFQILPVLLLAYGAGGATLGAAPLLGAPPLGWLGLLLLAAGGAGLVQQIHNGPMRHALAGAVHLAAHPRPDRFASGRATAMMAPDLNAARLGVAVPADFAWNQLAGFDACIQCGRCEAACPAFAAGAPLNPKKLIQDLAACVAPGDAASYTGSPYPGRIATLHAAGPHLPIVGEDAAISPDTLWACTTCRACVEECPMMIEHVDAVIGLRQFQVMERGAVPPKAAAALSALRYADDPAGRSLATRFDFAAGLDVPVITPDRPVEVLLWVGEGAFDPRYGRTLRALIGLLQHAGVDFAVLAAAERDCGDLARRLGDDAIFADLARANCAELRRYRFGCIVTADPHAYHALKNEYAGFGADFAVHHHTVFLAGLIAEGRIVPGALPETRVTYHDPCYLARYNGVVDAPRLILTSLGVTMREMQRHGTRALCCGGGGGTPYTDVPGKRRVGDIRMAQAMETGADIVAVACPGCTSMLEAVPGKRPEVRDVAELLWQSLVSSG